VTDAQNSTTVAAATGGYWDDQVAQFDDGGVNTNRAEWLAHPLVQQHHQRLLSGSALSWLADRLPAGIGRAVGFGSGTSQFELSLLAGGHIQELDLYDYSAAALAVAVETATRLGVSDRVRTHCTDMSEARGQRFDLAICRSSLHHAADMAATVRLIGDVLNPDGLLFAQEYVGPNRFGYPPEHAEVAKSLYRALAPELRTIWPELPQPDPAEVAKADPTESVQSEILLAEVGSAFNEVEVVELGGALPFMIWWGLNHDALWEQPAGLDLVNLLLELDEALLRSKRLPSYFGVLLAGGYRGLNG
jgi:SAM-dependent methyltransferase